MDERSTSEKLLDRIFPIRTTDDIVHRGLWTGSTVHESALARLPFIPRIASKILTHRIIGGRLITKETRQPIPDFVSGELEAKARNPAYLYPKFMVLSKVHWLLRTIFRASIGEVLTPGCTIEPRFKKKCTNCEKEYDSPEIEECEICEGKEFDTPNIDQYKTFRQLIGEDRDAQSLVGEGRTFKEFLHSTLWYLLALDDFYWELGHTEAYDPNAKKVVRVPRGVRVLDGSITFPVMDDYGNFTSDEYFCPVCYKRVQMETKQDEYLDLKSLTRKPATPKCKKCKSDLIQTAYIQKVGGKVVSRFGKDEVIHSSSSRIDPEAFGLSKIIAAVKLLYVIDYMDEYNLQIYSHGHASLILGIEGADKSKVEEIRTHVLNQLRSKTRRDARTGETEFSLEPIIVFIGMEQGRNITPVDISPKLGDMQSIDYYRLYVEKVCGLFGVTPVFVNISEPGTTGFTARPRIDVQNRVTRQYMSDVEEPFNDFLLPKLGITDWVLQFGKVESRDELRDMQIKQTVAMTVNLYERAGFDTNVAEDGANFTVSPTRVRDPLPTSRIGGGRTPQDSDGAPERTMPGGGDRGVPIQEPEDQGDES